MEYIPYTPDSAEVFYQQLEQWNDEDEYTRCIKVLETIPEEHWDYRAAYALARALENYAIIGDHDEGTSRAEGDKALHRAIDLLESVREEGKNKAEWNMRMAYGYQYLPEQEEQAIPYARRWAELDPSDGSAKAVIAECRREIEKRKKRNNRKKPANVELADSFEEFIRGLVNEDEFEEEENLTKKLNSKKYPDITYEVGKEIILSPDESGLPFWFDVEAELTEDDAAMTAVTKALDELDDCEKIAKAYLKAVLADEDDENYEEV